MNRTSSVELGKGVCYSVPYHCDIYSLPLDNLPIPKSRSRRTSPGNKSAKENLPIEPQTSPSEPSKSEETETFSDKNSSQTSLSDPATQHGNPSRLLFSSWPGERNFCPLSLALHNCRIRWDLSRGRGNESSHKKNEKSLFHRKFCHENGKKVGRDLGCPEERQNSANEDKEELRKPSFSNSILNLFRKKKGQSSLSNPTLTEVCEENESVKDQIVTYSARALPNLPSPSNSFKDEDDGDGEETSFTPLEPHDFSASIEKVKDFGWYWGPLSSEGAEDLLRGELDGSFIVRDSSDPRYIFSLTFKLNGLVRHVRIEHDQGNFSFGPLTRFKSSTIVDFIEKAVAHSRSGRYLFFLHRRPSLGPMRVQLLHPYSRFRHPRSLQHMTRFVILKCVRRDKLEDLNLPKPLLEYLSTPHYYFETQKNAEVEEK